MAISWNGASWLPSTPYLLNARAVNGGNVYIVTAPGTSASSGGPTGTGSAITDGTVTWAYLGAFTGAVTSVSLEDLSAISFPSQTVFLNLAETLVADVSVWGALLDDGRRYYAAHLGELARLQGIGPVTSQAVGPISQANASLMGDDVLLLTACGRQYAFLTRTLPTVFGICV